MLIIKAVYIVPKVFIR